MRRWLGLLAGCGLLALMGTGCDHVAGVCDCCPGNYCYFGSPGHHAPIMNAQQVGPEIHTAPAVQSAPVQFDSPPRVIDPK